MTKKIINEKVLTDNVEELIELMSILCDMEEDGHFKEYSTELDRARSLIDKVSEKIEYSPAPWRITHDSIFSDGYVAISSVLHKNLAEVVWRLDHEKRSPECEGNARLIRASPEMFEILKEIVENGEACDEHLTKARSIISKIV